MTDAFLSSMYSKKALEDLEQTLQIHRGMVWVDPATNSIAVKRITNPLEEDEDNTHFPGVTA